MIKNLKFIVVEDNEADRKEVLYQLADFDFEPDNNLGTAETYEEAKALIEENANNVDVIFLDLNLPRNDADGRPEKGHGRAVLDLVHEDLNRRANVDIKIIVVSGEDLVDGIQDNLLIKAYEGTLVGLVKKANLTIMLKANLKRLRKDPLRTRLIRNSLEIVDDYDVVIDPGKPIKERVISARSIGIKIAMNEVDYHNESLGSCSECNDDLNSLIENYIKIRFALGYGNKRHVKKSAITTEDGWAGFLWRGHIVQHLYTLNAYRNAFIHIAEQPFRSSISTQDSWEIPIDILEKAESGGYLGKVVELIVHELLEWYLPWHEQVYMPYFHPTS